MSLRSSVSVLRKLWWGGVLPTGFRNYTFYELYEDKPRTPVEVWILLYLFCNCENDVKWFKWFVFSFAKSINSCKLLSESFFVINLVLADFSKHKFYLFIDDTEFSTTSLSSFISGILVSSFWSKCWIYPIKLEFSYYISINYCLTLLSFFMISFLDFDFFSMAPYTLIVYFI